MALLLYRFHSEHPVHISMKGSNFRVCKTSLGNSGIVVCLLQAASEGEIFKWVDFSYRWEKIHFGFSALIDSSLG